jgi:type VI secretion system secreted protein Hcp
MEYNMKSVLVSSFRKGGSAQGGEGLPLEEVSFNFGEIAWTYTATDHKTGKRKGDVKAKWSTVANTGE